MCGGKCLNYYEFVIIFCRFYCYLCRDVHHIQYELLTVCGGGDITTTQFVGGKSSTAIIDQN